MEINNFKIWQLLRRDITQKDIETIAYVDWGAYEDYPEKFPNIEDYWNASAKANIEKLNAFIQYGEYIKEDDDLSDLPGVCMLSSFFKEGKNELISCFGSFLTIEIFEIFDGPGLEQKYFYSFPVNLALSALCLGDEYQEAIFEYLGYYEKKANQLLESRTVIHGIEMGSLPEPLEFIALVFLLLSMAQKETKQTKKALDSLKKGCKIMCIDTFFIKSGYIFVETEYNYFSSLSKWLDPQISLKQVFKELNEKHKEISGSILIEEKERFIIPSPSTYLPFWMSAENMKELSSYSEAESFDLRNLNWLKAEVDINKF